MKTIVNGAPGVVDYGVLDASTANYVRAPEQLPQHLPKYFIFAKKGPSIRDARPEQLLAGNDRLLMYGAETFDENSKYFNHQTMFANGVDAEGNAAMYVRLLAPDAGPKPTIRIYLDVLPTQIDLYQRNSDGSIKTTIAGDPIVVGQAPGYRVKFVTEHFTTLDEAQQFGAAVIQPGDQTDAAGTQSQRYPIFEQEHSFYGEDGNLAGIRLWAQTTANVSTLPTKLMAREKVYPFSYAVVRKDAKTGTASTVETVFGEQAITVVFKPNVVDPISTKRIYFGEQALNAYQSLTDPKYAPLYGEFGRQKIYQDNIDLLLAKFQAAEVPFLTDTSDFTADPADMYLFNFVTGTDSSNVPYQSFIFADGPGAVRFSSSTNVYAAGGTDGTMDHQTHANLVSEYMQRYANPSDELNDIAYHVESHIYDSGFPLETKYDLINFIANRHDTFVHLSPNEFGQPPLSPSEEYSVASALQSRLEMHPESVYFGTPVFRGMIMGSTGSIRGAARLDKYPVGYEVGRKSARYMGASNGAWKSGANPDGYPGHILEYMFDLSNPWTPDDVRNRNWDAGLNWIERFDRSSFNFPAMKTVYGDDTSVLTGYLTACAIIQLNKVVRQVQRMFSGTEGLTPAQFTQRVNDAVVEKVKGRFDGRYIITPKAYFTSLDQVRNYSWTLPVDIGAPGMKTVMTTYTVARRIEEMLASSSN